MDVQPVTILVIRASLPEMTGVLLGARVAFFAQGVQRLDAPWSKSVQLGRRFGVRHLAFILSSQSARTISRPVVHSARRGPSKQGSFTPAKDPPHFMGRT